MDFLGDLVSFLLVFCAVSLVLMLALTAFVIYRLRNIWQSSTTDMQKLYTSYKQQHPEADDRDILKRLVQSQARRCGVIGIFTSFGGFLTMVFALPIDLYLTGRIQHNLARFIAQHYGSRLDVNAPELARVRDNLSMSVDAQIGRGQRRLQKETAQFITSKIASKFIPFVGAFMGYRFNYQEAQQTGMAALNYFAENRIQLPASS